MIVTEGGLLSSSQRNERASAESFYAFSVCLLAAIRAALLVINDMPVGGDGRKIERALECAIVKHPDRSLTTCCIFPY
jgi:hypothetical protein